MLARAVDSPVIRGGITLGAGVLAGNILGFGRVALMAYLMGTHSRADSLAVAIGPMETFNAVLVNGIVFAFVPMLTACKREERAALYLKLTRCFAWALAAIVAAMMIAAPWLMRAMAPGLDPRFFDAAVTNLRILSLSSIAAGVGAVQSALLYTDRRFGPTAFYQATVNIFTIAGALALFKTMGVYSFTIGHSVGAWVQLGVVWYAARKGLSAARAPCDLHWREILTKPGFFVLYAAGIALNITFTRAWATHTGPGMAAALDYCMRGVSVPLALLVGPLSNSLLPEIARLRSLSRIRDAFRLIDKTIGLVAVVAVSGCVFAIVFRQPAIALMFQRGSFTAESTRLVSAVFLGLGPCLIGWSLLEITSRTLFALDRPWPPVLAAFIPVLLNLAVTLKLQSARPEFIGVGAAVGLFAASAVLFFVAHIGRERWLKQTA